jgi:hypothetical protein
LDQLSTAPRNIKGEVKRSTYILYSMVVRRSFEREMGSCWNGAVARAGFAGRRRKSVTYWASEFPWHWVLGLYGG